MHTFKSPFRFQLVLGTRVYSSLVAGALVPFRVRGVVKQSTAKFVHKNTANDSDSPVLFVFQKASAYTVDSFLGEYFSPLYDQDSIKVNRSNRDERAKRESY